MREFFIEGNVPSLKNSKIVTSRGVFPSKTVRKYLQELGVQSYSVTRREVKDYKTRENKFRRIESYFQNLTYPCKIGFHFVRGSKHSFDFGNAIHIIADLMVAHGYIEDDDADHFIPHIWKRNGTYYSYDSGNPGVWIKIY